MKLPSSSLRSAARLGVPRARARFLTQAMQLEESDAPGLVRAGVVLTALLLAGGVAWASVTELPELARAPGEVVPAGRVRQVQHLDGGIVETIAVRDGDRVSAGDVLVTLDPAVTRAELDQLRARQAVLELEHERVSALLDGRPPRLVHRHARHDGLAAGQAALHEAQVASHRDQVGLARARASQREAELAALEGEVDSARDEIALLEELRSMQADLVGQRAVARADLISVRLRLAEATGEYRELAGRQRVAADALAEARQGVTELESRLREALRKEAGQHAAGLAEVEQAILRTEDRLAQHTIRAPVSGIVQGLDVEAISEVIEPRQVILEIVPVGRELVVEARISTRDIGHVRAGQPVDVKVNSYESTRYGTIPGTLRRLSPSTFLDAQGRPFYLAEVALERDHMGHDPERHQVLPGMTVQAHVMTGRKSVLDYMLKPVYRGFQGAFTER